MKKYLYTKEDNKVTQYERVSPKDWDKLGELSRDILMTKNGVVLVKKIETVEVSL